jgi:hypothetical protein
MVDKFLIGVSSFAVIKLFKSFNEIKDKRTIARIIGDENLIELIILVLFLTNNILNLLSNLFIWFPIIFTYRRYYFI